MGDGFAISFEGTDELLCVLTDVNNVFPEFGDLFAEVADVFLDARDVYAGAGDFFVGGADVFFDVYDVRPGAGGLVGFDEAIQRFVGFAEFLQNFVEDGLEYFFVHNLKDVSGNLIFEFGAAPVFVPALIVVSVPVVVKVFSRFLSRGSRLRSL